MADVSLVLTRDNIMIEVLHRKKTKTKFDFSESFTRLFHALCCGSVAQLVRAEAS